MTTVSNNSDQPSRWTALNIVLHWLIVVLIILQWLTADFMGKLLRAQSSGNDVGGTSEFLAYGHAAIGILVLLSILTRLFDRFYQGRPPHPTETPNWANLVAKITHFLLYATLIVMPLSGMAAFFGGIKPAKEVHELLWTPLLVLVAVHVVGALVNHFHYKNDVLVRMMPGRGR